MAMTVLIAARFLSLCVPGEMMSLMKELIVARTQEEGGEEDGDSGPPADNAFGKRGRSPSACSARRATARRSRLAMSSGCSAQL